jgi:hypothetical protein
MSSVEQSVKADFARVFVESDWRLFKEVAEFYIERAARLRIGDMKGIDLKWRLLARNVEKRLRIGIGTELLLKALYLRHGFVINKPVKKKSLCFPFTVTQAQGIELDHDRTYTLDELIRGLSKVPAMGKVGQLDRGLRIAKVFRNKEGHGVLPKHAFQPQNYRDIEQALVEVYARGFTQTLHVRFSIKTGEKAVWNIK